MNGVLNINKSAGITSHDVVSQVRKITGMKKVGHAGTLDPFAEGVLIVAVGNATRLLEYIKVWPKTYTAEITLGAVSDTDDKTGTITPKSNRKPTRQEISHALADFLGPQLQIPPAYAAIKVRGKKLYEYARAGQGIERQPRPVTIHDLKLLQYTYPTLELTTKVSSGTYIRALGRDIGEVLSTGAYVSRLIRKVIHKFHIDNSIPISDITRETLSINLQTPQVLVSSLPSLTLSPDNVAKWERGQVTSIAKDVPVNQPIAVFGPDQELLGIGRADPASPLLHPQKVLCFSNAAN